MIKRDVFGQPLEQVPTRELCLRSEKAVFLFDFRHDEARGTVCKFMIHALEMLGDMGHVYKYEIIASTKLHHDDTFDEILGARLAAKRAIYTIEKNEDYDSDEFERWTGVTQKELYTAVRKAIPLNENKGKKLLHVKEILEI